MILMTTYSAGLRASEVIALKPKNIENKKMLIKVQDGKGGKDRYTLLSKRLLNELRDYYKTYRPKIYLFPSSYKHKNTLFTRKWGVSVRDSVKRSDHVLEYLARYTHRVAIVNSRIKTLKNGRVSFTAKDRKKNRTASITISAVQFIRRFLLHSLPKGFVRIRHYGFLANRNRMVNLKTIRRLLKLPCQLTKMQASLKDMMLQLTGTDITRCPCCNKGKMQLLEKIPMYRARAPNYLAAVVG